MDLLLQPQVMQLFSILGKETTRIVGGALRDALLGRTVADIDLATTLLPEEVMAKGQAAGFTIIPTGLKHGTVTVGVQGKLFEVTTLRKDEETDGRHAVVTFGHDWEADAHRRDFTINALYLDAYGQIYDYVGGLADLEKRHIRFIGDARARIQEDYLRILRFFRFHALCGEGFPDEAGLAAAQAEKQGLSGISRERVRYEFLKILEAERAVAVLEVMETAGILDMIVPQPNLEVWRNLFLQENEMGMEHDSMRGLAALIFQSGQDADATARHLRLSNDEKKRLALLNPEKLKSMTSHGWGEALYRLGKNAFRDNALLCGAAGQMPEWRAAIEYQKINHIPTFPLYGKDIVAKGIPSGPQIGVVLKRAESLWIAEGFPMEPECIDAFLMRAIKLSS